MTIKGKSGRVYEVRNKDEGPNTVSGIYFEGYPLAWCNTSGSGFRTLEEALVSAEKRAEELGIE